MKSKQVYAMSLLCLIILTSCTRVYYTNNYSEKTQVIQIVYKTKDNCENRNSMFDYYNKKGTIHNLSLIKDGDFCVFKFELMPNKNLPLTNLIRVYSVKNDPNEERFLCIKKNKIENDLGCDTILHKIGEKEVLNKFTEKSKFFGLLGKKTYVYYFAN